MLDYNYEKYSDEELQAQINRLRNELNALKQVVSDRAEENALLKKDISKTQELLAVIHRSIDKISVKIEDVDTSVAMSAHDMNDVIEEELTRVSDLIENKAKELNENLKQTDFDEEVKGIDKKIDKISEHLETKFGPPTIRLFRKKIDRLSVLSIANAVGCFISLAILIVLVLAIL